MPRKYIRKSTRRSWSVGKLSDAVRAVQQGLPKRKVSEIYGIPRKTLSRYMAIAASGSNLEYSVIGSFPSVFSSAQEQELVKHITDMSSYGTGLSRHDVRNLAYQLAERKHIKHRFCHETELAGRDWLDGFLKRHPELSLRKPEATSLARLKGFNRSSVGRFFELLTTNNGSCQYPPSRIWNADETGFSTVPTRSVKVLAKKGVRQVPGVSSGERGVNTTAIMAMSASGQYLAPMLIFPRKRMNDALKLGAPPETIFASRPTQDAPVLLILDGHSSHTRNLDMIEKARQNHVKILSIPPHTSHKLQPLDVAFMGPLKSNYSKAVNSFLKKNPGKTVTIYNVAALINEAFTASASISTAKNGFRATGIYPLNPQVFSEEDFAPADHFIRDNESETAETGIQFNKSSSNAQQDGSIGFEIENSEPIASLTDANEILVLDPAEYYSLSDDGTVTIHHITSEDNLASECNIAPTSGVVQNMSGYEVNMEKLHEPSNTLLLDSTSSHGVIAVSTDPPTNGYPSVSTTAQTLLTSLSVVPQGDSSCYVVDNTVGIESISSFGHIEIVNNDPIKAPDSFEYDPSIYYGIAGDVTIDSITTENYSASDIDDISVYHNFNYFLIDSQPHSSGYGSNAEMVRHEPSDNLQLASYRDVVTDNTVMADMTIPERQMLYDKSSTDPSNIQPPKKRNKKTHPKRQTKKEQSEELTSSPYPLQETVMAGCFAFSAKSGIMFNVLMILTASHVMYAFE
ncbi:uncharacterized protein LOC110678151 [Aedes aegypti]|uniref:Uncharacterized protein n=1 Tax=Aedes aegypti TaxID=7159 RepID=A0A6I8TZS3_AEDAE|nr:uncharacterized protein LOC110678151 [Aedes aegypti]